MLRRPCRSIATDLAASTNALRLSKVTTACCHGTCVPLSMCTPNENCLQDGLACPLLGPTRCPRYSAPLCCSAGRSAEVKGALPMVQMIGVSTGPHGRGVQLRLSTACPYEEETSDLSELLSCAAVLHLALCAFCSIGGRRASFCVCHFTPVALKARPILKQVSTCSR